MSKEVEFQKALERLLREHGAELWVQFRKDGTVWRHSIVGVISNEDAVLEKDLGVVVSGYVR